MTSLTLLHSLTRYSLSRCYTRYSLTLLSHLALLVLPALIPLLAWLRYLPLLPLQQLLAFPAPLAVLQLRRVPLLHAQMASLTLL